MHSNAVIFIDNHCGGPYQRQGAEERSITSWGMTSTLIYSNSIALSMLWVKASFRNAGAPSRPPRTTWGSRIGRRVCYIFLNIKGKYSGAFSTQPHRVILTYQWYTPRVKFVIIPPNFQWQQYLWFFSIQLAVGCSAYKLINVVRVLTAKEKYYVINGTVIFQITVTFRHS